MSVEIIALADAGKQAIELNRTMDDAIAGQISEVKERLGELEAEKVLTSAKRDMLEQLRNRQADLIGPHLFRDEAELQSLTRFEKVCLMMPLGELWLLWKIGNYGKTQSEWFREMVVSKEEWAKFLPTGKNLGVIEKIDDVTNLLQTIDGDEGLSQDDDPRTYQKSSLGKQVIEYFRCDGVRQEIGMEDVYYDFQPPNS